MSLTTHLRAPRTIKAAIPKPITQRFASTKSSTPRRAVYFGPDVYWGKAFKNAAGTGLLYIPMVAAVMFWPAPIAPLFNLSKGIKNKKAVDA
ncbi:hypothetical protein NHQ30_002227 [Ciborinia camelliae]|nr:hypothetical protein NHQ30_002227 [Ciborinia camelliae]